MLLTAEDRLGRARVVLERRGLTADDLLPPAIAESWNRCLSTGLDPRNPPPRLAIGDAELRAVREEHAALRKLALGEMQNLYDQIAGTNFMIAFAAPDGLLLDTIADPSFATAARASSIRPGTLWSEPQCGTNALGTAALTRRTITVHGGEHFFTRYGDLTCMAAPVFDPGGGLAGVLDASSDCRSRQQHTRALVSMAATQIENGLFRERHRRDLLIAFHSRAEYLHTLNAGLLAMDPEGVVLASNAQARFLLQGLPAAPGRRFEELFRTPFAQFLDSGRDGDRQRLDDRVGSAFAARIENLHRPRPLAIAAPGLRRGFVADDPAVAAARRQVEAAAARGLPILIRGETGTGKEELARHAHAASGRRGRFVPVNCAALPDSLAEAELFGHADGAFTGARRGGAPGLAVEADGGTLFLDEIGDMKPASQAVLLRLLDDWTVRPVGGGKPRRVDTLLVAATNADLDAAIAAGRFRSDLRFRLDVVTVSLPPLRERSDLPAIARHLLATIAPGARLSADGAVALAALPWPGNVRELRNALTRLTLADPNGVVDAAALVQAVGAAAVPAPQRSLRDSARAQVATMHDETGRNVSETARRLGISRNRVYRALRA